MVRDPRTIFARRWRVGAALTAVMMTAYFGFVLLVAYGRDTAGALIAGGRISVGIVLGASVIALAPVLTAIYVRWANRHYDPAIAALREGARAEGGPGGDVGAGNENEGGPGGDGRRGGGAA